MAQTLSSCEFALSLDSWLFDVSGTMTISTNPNIHFFPPVIHFPEDMNH